MPFAFRKKRNRKCYEVYNRDEPSKKKAKCTTKNKAKAQLRILNQWQRQHSVLGKERENKTSFFSRKKFNKPK